MRILNVAWRNFTSYGNKTQEIGSVSIISALISMFNILDKTTESNK